MSINSMANAAVARRLDVASSSNAMPKGLREIAKAAATPPTPGPAPADTTAAPAQSASAVDTALNVLIGYIPTEILTLYVAVLAAIQPASSPVGVTTAQRITYWCFLGATPIVAWLVYAVKVKALQKPLPVKFGEWPLWEMFAATIAYCAWALALPDSPRFPWYTPALSSIVVLVASTGLGLLAPLFQRPLGS